METQSQQEGRKHSLEVQAHDIISQDSNQAANHQMDHLGKHESRNKVEQIQATDDIEEESIPQDI